MTKKEKYQKALDDIKEFTLVSYDEDGEEIDCGDLYPTYLKEEIEILQDMINRLICIHNGTDEDTAFVEVRKGK